MLSLRFVISCTKRTHSNDSNVNVADLDICGVAMLYSQYG